LLATADEVIERARHVCSWQILLKNSPVEAQGVR